MHFGIGEVPKAPTDDRFVKIFMFFPLPLGRRAPVLVIPCFPIAKGDIWAPLVSSPYRIVTNLYTTDIEFYQLFLQTSVLYGRAIDFNFWAVPSL